MTDEPEPSSPPLRRPPGRLGTYAPWPLLGIAVLLIVLIIFTPQLVSNTRQPTPGILTQAELVVDKTTSNASIHFYVWALGETIRYSSITVGVATEFNWTGMTTAPFGKLNWTSWHNGSEVLSVIFATTENPVALNITVHYVSPEGTAWYVGLFAFYVASTTPTGSEVLYSQSGTSGVAVESPLTVSNDSLPDVILLHSAGSGSSP
ncbi:MAG TPA: hypothetical protein VEJ85_00610 [Thermoplasmata archaeon]|nr:hypothetical protein [Thermoplasmata archaeon]